MADAGGHRAKRLAAIVVIGVDDGNGHLGAHLDDELARAHELIRAQREVWVHLGADRTIGVIPDVMHAAIDEFLQPLFGEQFVDVRLANAGGDTGEKPFRGDNVRGRAGFC